MPDSPRHDPLAALRQPPFLVYTVGRFASGAGSNMLQAALAWEVYEISHDPFALGVMGLVRFVPQLLLALFAGAVADAVDRRGLVIASQIATLLCAAVLLFASMTHHSSLLLIYAVIVLIALASEFEHPARLSMLASIVRPETFQNAITVSQTFGALASISGPALAGLGIATVGVAGAYGGFVALQIASIVSSVLLRPRDVEGERGEVSLGAIKEGLRFVLGHEVLMACMSLDLVAVIFGGAEALLPVYATDVLHVGGIGYGILAASLNAGGLLAAVGLVAFPQIQRPGRALIAAVAGFGLATIWFGLSRSLPLSVAAYAMVGMSDQVSNVMRSTTENIATPDALRGRMNSVSSLFSGTSNQLGAVESGFVAAAMTPTFAVVTGGIGCLIALGLVHLLAPHLWRYRIEDLEAEAAGGA